MNQPRTEAQKESYAKIKKRKGSENYHWCSSLKRYLPKDHFYRNSAQPSGFQTECKVVSKARAKGVSIDHMISNLPYKEKRLYV